MPRCVETLVRMLLSSQLDLWECWEPQLELVLTDDPVADLWKGVAEAFLVATLTRKLEYQPASVRKTAQLQ
jgi:hypothetical protein